MEMCLGTSGCSNASSVTELRSASSPGGTLGVKSPNCVHKADEDHWERVGPVLVGGLLWQEDPRARWWGSIASCSAWACNEQHKAGAKCLNEEHVFVS